MEVSIPTKFQAFDRSQVNLVPSEYKERFQVNRDYLMSLDSDDLLFHHRHEAVLNRRFPDRRVDNKMARYDSTSLGGWESPGCQVRGQFVGHWLSAAARIYATDGDPRIKAKADYMISELARFQEHNGDGWVGSIPQKYFEKMEKGQPSWAPQYVLHKTMMGLWEIFKFAGNRQALDILDKSSDWFHAWSGKFSKEKFHDMIDGYETGGMFEVWSDLYGETGDSKYLDLIGRYDRRGLFDCILQGEDVLSGEHANTIIPEIYGAARAYEVTGDDRFRRVVEAFWQEIVPSRMNATGGHTHGERWSYPNRLAETLLDTISSNQELCTVYNMMWLAKYLFRWTGDAQYADYYERNFYNGILSGHHPESGVFTYYHPFKSGGKKRWDSRTQHFWCCYGTGVQAYAELPNGIYFHSEDELAVNLFVPSEVEWSVGGRNIKVTQQTNFPLEEETCLRMNVDGPVAFKLALRVPWWLGNEARISVNGEAQDETLRPSSYHVIERTWQDGDEVRFSLPMHLYACPLPDDPSRVTVMYGPLALAAVAEGEVNVSGDPAHPGKWVDAKVGTPLRFTVRGSEGEHEMLPLYQIVDDPFALYLTVKS